jgi:hypothetical protein
MLSKYLEHISKQQISSLYLLQITHRLGKPASFSFIKLIFTVVKKVCVYILLMLMAADYIDLHQLFKLPILFQHFAEHKKRDHKIDLIDFLAMHYWGHDINDKDNDRDMQLPFKKADAHPIHVFFLPITRAFLVKAYVQPVKVNHPVYQHIHFPNPAVSSLFRPPCA